MTRHAKISAALWFTALALLVLTVLLAMTGCGPDVRNDPKVIVPTVAASLTESAKTLRVLTESVEPPMAGQILRVADSLDANAAKLLDAGKALAAASADMDGRIQNLKDQIADLEAEQSAYMKIVLAGCVGLGLLLFAGGGWGVWTGGGKPAWGIVVSGVLLAGSAFVLPQIGKPIGYGLAGIVLLLAAWCAIILARKFRASLRSTAAGVDEMESVALTAQKMAEGIVEQSEAEHDDPKVIQRLGWVRSQLAESRKSLARNIEAVKGNLSADQIGVGAKSLVAKARGKAAKP